VRLVEVKSTFLNLSILFLSLLIVLTTNPRQVIVTWDMFKIGSRQNFMEAIVRDQKNSSFVNLFSTKFKRRKIKDLAFENLDFKLDLEIAKYKIYLFLKQFVEILNVGNFGYNGKKKQISRVF
jgi:hypothetical protein